MFSSLVSRFLLPLFCALFFSFLIKNKMGKINTHPIRNKKNVPHLFTSTAVSVCRTKVHVQDLFLQQEVGVKYPLWNIKESMTNWLIFLLQEHPTKIEKAKRMAKGSQSQIKYWENFLSLALYNSLASLDRKQAHSCSIKTSKEKKRVCSLLYLSHKTRKKSQGSRWMKAHPFFRWKVPPPKSCFGGK